MSSDDHSAKSSRVDDSSRDVEKAVVETQRQQPGQTVRTTISKADLVVLEMEIVPRSKRRGLLGKLSIIPEVTNPYSYSPAIKWWMTVIVSFAAITSSIGSSIFYPALSEVARDIHTTPTVANLSLALYMLAMAFTPMWWSALSEKHGHRTIYIVSFTPFLNFFVHLGMSVNVAMLLLFRTLSGGVAASVQSVGAGTVADVWEPKERGKAMGIFFLGPVCGPGLAPVIGGALTEVYADEAPCETVKKQAYPETPEDEKKSLIISLFRKVFGPFAILALLRYPPVTIAVWTGSISFLAIFVLNVSIQSTFEKEPYNFSTILVGLLYLAPTIGYACSSILGGRWIDHIMAREARKANRYDENGKPKFLPEDRMKENLWIAVSLYPAALIWYGWSVDKGLHWAIGAAASLVYGLDVMLVMGAVTTVLTEFTPKRPSSGVALANFALNLLSCTGPVVTQPLIDAIGSGWTCTMVALIAFMTGNAAIFALRT